MWPLVLAGQDYFSQCRVVSQRGVTFKSVLSRKTVVCVCVCLCVVAAGVRVWRKWGQVVGVCENVKNAISAYTLSL